MPNDSAFEPQKPSEPNQDLNPPASPQDVDTVPPVDEPDHVQQAETIPPQAPVPQTDSKQPADPTLTQVPENIEVPGYEILGELGRGGMGVVYKARHLELNRLVALKMILAGGHAGAQDVQRFLSEAEAVAAFSHPHIVQVYDFGRHNNLPYMALEFVTGGSLADKIKDRPLPAKEAAHLVEQIARGMNAAHQAGIVHRDLKPENVLLTNNGTPKVTDFGIAKRVQGGAGMTQTGHIMGTPSYMAPEQAGGEGKRVGPAADVYALGAILYACLTGRPPFQSDSVMNTLLQVISQEPVRPRALNPSVAADVETICLKCLAKNPHRRYASAHDLAEDLRSWQSGEPIMARPVSQVERVVKWMRRNPVISVLAVATLLVLLCGIGVSSYFAYTANREATAARTAEKKADQEAQFARKAQQDAEERAQAEAKAKQEAQDEKKRADEEAKAARKAEADAKTRAKAEAKAKALAQAETKRAEREQKRAERETTRAEQQLTRAEWLVYAGKLALAQSAFAEGNAVLARQYLGECQWNLRGWEHDHLWTRFNSKQTLVGHTRKLTSVAYSPDGRRIVTGSDDRTAKVWDAETGQEILSLTGHPREVNSVAYSPDGKHIVTASWGLAKVWDAASGKEAFTLQGHGSWISSVAYSPDGKRIVTGSRDHTAKVWNAETGQPIVTLKGHISDVTCVRYYRNGSRIVSTSVDKTAKVWDAQTGKLALTLKGHTKYVQGVAFSPDDKRLVTSSGDNTAKVWDAETGQELLTLTAHSNGLTGVGFSRNGKRLFTSSHDGTMKIWDTVKSQDILSLQGHVLPVTCVAISADNKRIVTSSYDMTAKIWDAVKGQELLTLQGHTREIGSVALSSNGRYIVTGSVDNTAKVWNAETGQALHTLKGHMSDVRSVAFSPDGKRLVTGSDDASAKVWNVETGRELLAIKGHNRTITGVVWSPNNKRIVTCSMDSTAKVWNADTSQELVTLKGHTSAVTSVAYSSDGKRIVTGSVDHTAKVWDGQTGQVLFTLRGHPHEISSVACSPDGKHIVTAGPVGMVKIWDAYTGLELSSLTSVQYTGLVTSIAYSPDGKRIVIGGGESHKFGEALVWDVNKRPDPKTNHWPLVQLTQRKRYHAAQAALAEKAKQWFAVAFHLGKVADCIPWDAKARANEAQAWQKAGQPGRAAVATVRILLISQNPWMRLFNMSPSR